MKRKTASSPDSLLSPEIGVLTQRMLSAALEHNEASEHKAIYDHITERIIPVLPPLADYPPLHVLAYAIRGILVPTVIYAQIPQMLNIFAHIERLRGLFTDRVEHMLKWDDHFKTTDHRHMNLLREDERQFIEDLPTHLGDNMRSVYRLVVNGFSQLHVYETWFSVNHAKVENLLRTYFPQLMRDSDLSDGHLFHHGLSNEELEDSMDAGDQCIELIERYVRHKEEGQIIDPTSRAARELYPPLVDEEELSSLLLWYLDELEQAVQAVNDILASTDPSPNLSAH